MADINSSNTKSMKIICQFKAKRSTELEQFIFDGNDKIKTKKSSRTFKFKKMKFVTVT